MTSNAPDPSPTYRRDTVAPAERFDDVEATISHLFREPHPALQGRTYGEALHDALKARGLLETHTVYELGGGLGFVAQSAVARSANTLRWRFIELSRPLARAQRAALPSSLSIAAHAEALPFRDRSLSGLFLANEVIADLRIGQDEALATKLGARPAARLNLGAFALIHELARVLAPGAHAVLTEFGGDFGASPVTLAGDYGRGMHVEHSIHFGHLEQLAREAGLEATRVPLADLLGFDKELEVASYPDCVRLRRFVPRLPILAHPRRELERAHPFLTRFFRFDFPKIGSPRFPDPKSRGGLCQLFFALILTQRT